MPDVKYSEAVARLATLPAVLPASYPALRPMRIGEDGKTHATETLNDRMQPGVGGPGEGGTGVAPGVGRPASVLVLVTPGEDGDAHVILTERVARGNRPHSGEISFPGGVVEPEDVDAVATALREANEEVGLDAEAAGVRVIGLLDLFYIPVSGFAVTPVLAIAERRPVLVASPAEVARILEAPLRHFLPGAPIEVHERPMQDWRLRYGAFHVEEVVVWGATARILGQLGALLGD